MRRPHLAGRSVFIARMYLATMLLLGFAALFFTFFGILLVTVPCAVTAAAVYMSLALMRWKRPAGDVLLAMILSVIAAFFLWAQVRVGQLVSPPFIVQDVGSALHHHLFPYSPLVLGLIHAILAVAALPWRSPFKARALARATSET